MVVGAAQELVARVLLAALVAVEQAMVVRQEVLETLHQHHQVKAIMAVAQLAKMAVEVVVLQQLVLMLVLQLAGQAVMEPQVA
jgi:predicted Fe-Mo cluster-binding NifX family protein